MTLLERSQTRQILSAPALLHPGSVAAIGVLALNDHVLKYRYANAITGKLSDLAGLVFFPILLATVLVAISRIGRNTGIPDRSALIAGLVATGLVFLLVNTTPWAELAYEQTQGFIQAPVRLLLGQEIGPTSLTRDVSDVPCLVSLVLAWRIGTGRRILPDRSSRLENP